MPGERKPHAALARKSSVSRHGAFLSGLAVLCALAVVIPIYLVFGSFPPAQAEQSGDDADVPDPPDVPDALDAPPERNFFEPYPAGDAIAYDDLDDIEKATVSRSDEWAQTDHGPTVHQRFSQASRQAAERAAKKQAEAESGLDGIGEVGVQ